MDRIPYEKRVEVYAEAIDHYGIENQLYKAVEEMSELTKEIMKSFRPGETTVDKIAEELADTIITLEQVQIIFGINEDVCFWMDKKVEMLSERIRKELAGGDVPVC